MRDVGQRLRRLLYVVPYVAKHMEGVPVDELAAMLDVSREHMLRDIDMLTQVGPPDGDPGEYLLVSVEDGRVFVDLPQRLTRPLRLTPAEGCSLLLGIRTLRESGVAPFDDALESAEMKLLKALGHDAIEAENLATGTIVAEPERIVAQHLRELVTAARQRRTVSIDYVSASSHEAKQRRFDPYGIVHHAGEWYVVGHCHKRGDTRTFRIDRIAALASTDAAFELPDDFDLETYRREQLYVPSADAVTVQVHLEPLATARVGSAWPVGQLTVHEDGSSDIAIECEGFEWVTGWVLGFGKHAWITGPEEARAAMRTRLERLAHAIAASADGDEPVVGIADEAEAEVDVEVDADVDADADADAEADADADAGADAEVQLVADAEPVADADNSADAASAPAEIPALDATSELVSPDASEAVDASSR